VRHQRQARFLRHLQRDVEWRGPRIAARNTADANLDSHDGVAIGLSDLDGIQRADEPHVAALPHHDAPREGKDAGERNVQVSQDACLARFDDVFEKAPVIAGAGAPRVDERCHAAAPCQKIGIDAQRRAAPVDMPMQIDEAGRDDPVCDIVDFGLRRHKVGTRSPIRAGASPAPSPRANRRASSLASPAAPTPPVAPWRAPGAARRHLRCAMLESDWSPATMSDGLICRNPVGAAAHVRGSLPPPSPVGRGEVGHQGPRGTGRSRRSIVR
jgi:hypothetical protein